MAAAGVRQADRDLPCNAIAVERGEHLQLLELIAAAVGGTVEVGELFAGRDHPRRERDGAFDRAQRLGVAPLLAQAQADEVVRVGHAIVETDGFVQRRQRRVDGAAAITGHRHLVVDARRPVVEADRAIVGVRGAIVALELVEHVAERLERPGGGRVERRGLPEVAGGRVEVAALAASLVRLPATQVSEHRVGTQGDRAAVGFNRAERLVVVQRRVAVGQQGAVIALPGGGLVGEGRAHASQRQKCHRGN